MGKDKKDSNPVDSYRKQQKKKDIQKSKRDKKAVHEVKSLLNDPKKVDAEIAILQKEYDQNKLDKGLKERIKELNVMKNLAEKKEKLRNDTLKLRSINQPEKNNNTDVSSQNFEADETLGDELLISTKESRNPEDSVYYHCVYNPTGAPPPGQLPMYKSAKRDDIGCIKEINRTDGSQSNSQHFNMAPPPPPIQPIRPQISHQFPHFAVGGVNGIPLPPPRPPPPTGLRNPSITAAQAPPSVPVPVPPLRPPPPLTAPPLDIIAPSLTPVALTIPTAPMLAPSHIAALMARRMQQSDSISEPVAETVAVAATDPKPLKEHNSMLPLFDYSDDDEANGSPVPHRPPPPPAAAAAPAGPKPVKVDRALTAFVPSALRIRRPTAQAQVSRPVRRVDPLPGDEAVSKPQSPVAAQERPHGSLDDAYMNFLDEISQL